MILSMAVVMIPMHIRFVVCGELTIPHLGLIYYCFYKRKIAMRNLGRPSRSDFVQTEFIKVLLCNWGEVNLFTRPRRFGKSLNMSMLEHFFH